MSFFTATTRVTQRTLPEGAPPPRYGRFTIAFKVSKKLSSTMDIRANSHFKTLSVAFESVELLECQLELSFPPSTDTAAVQFGLVPNTVGSMSELLACPIISVRYLSSATASCFTLDLPGDHNFGRELKATVLGNSTPVAYVINHADCEGYATLRFRAAFHGSALG